MKNIFTLLLLAFAAAASAQTAILRTVGIVVVDSIPTHTPSAQGALVALDTNTNWTYTWDGSAWQLSGFGVQQISGCASPGYTPGRAHSYVVINACDSLYYYTGAAWRHLNKFGGTTDGASANQVLFADSNSVAKGDADFTFNEATNTLQSSNIDAGVGTFNASLFGQKIKVFGQGDAGIGIYRNQNSANFSKLEFIRSYGTSAAPLPVAETPGIADISSWVYDSTNQYKRATRILTEATGHDAIGITSRLRFVLYTKTGNDLSLFSMFTDGANRGNTVFSGTGIAHTKTRRATTNIYGGEATTGMSLFVGASTDSSVIIAQNNRRVAIAKDSAFVTLDVGGTDGIKIPNGTTEQRPSGVSVFRYNATTQRSEISEDSLGVIVWRQVSNTASFVDESSKIDTFFINLASVNLSTLVSAYSEVNATFELTSTAADMIVTLPDPSASFRNKKIIAWIVNSDATEDVVFTTATSQKIIDNHSKSLLNEFSFILNNPNNYAHILVTFACVYVPSFSQYLWLPTTKS